jgi:hypothetical protein
MNDFLRALAKRLGECFGEKYALYYGQVLQGQRGACFFVQPPVVERSILPGGRIRRTYSLEIHFYPGKQDEPGLQQQIGERLVCRLNVLNGEKRSYRGRNLTYEAGEDFLKFSAVYVFYTTQELEMDEEYAVNHGDFMLEFSFAANSGVDNADNVEENM